MRTPLVGVVSIDTVRTHNVQHYVCINGNRNTRRRIVQSSKLSCARPVGHWRIIIHKIKH